METPSKSQAITVLRKRGQQTERHLLRCAHEWNGARERQEWENAWLWRKAAEIANDELDRIISAIQEAGNGME